MFIDLTLKITPKMAADAAGNEKKVLVGHLGTHFDVMNKVFPLSYLKRKAYVFDVSGISDRDITSSDIDMSLIEPDMFIGFYTGFIEKVPYGSIEYHKLQPALSVELIDKLIEKKISIIGIDFMGVRKSVEHTPMDQHCADNGVFIIENMVDLGKVANRDGLIINTYPMNYEGVSGLPCRVVAEVK